MRKNRVLEGDLSEIVCRMKECINPDEYRRIQCVYLGMLYPDMPAKKIGEVTLSSESRVWAIHAEYRENGLPGLIDGRGGRYRQYMSLAEEAKFLEPYEEKSKTGTLVEASGVKKAYEEIVGQKVAKSTIYRLLARHGFRQIVPYKRHRKADTEEQEAFKKTSSPM